MPHKPGKATFKCTRCPRKFKSIFALAAHKRFHTKRVPVVVDTPGLAIDPAQVQHLRDVNKRSWRAIAATLHASPGGVRAAYQKAIGAAPERSNHHAKLEPAPNTSTNPDIRAELLAIKATLRAKNSLIVSQIDAVDEALKYFPQ
jgi:hypothetical protein